MVYLSIPILYPSTQFEELYRPFINLGSIYPQKIILPFITAHEAKGPLLNDKSP